MKDILKNDIYLEDIECVIKSFSMTMFNGRKILITGGLGLICSAVVDLLIVYNQKNNAGIKIYIADINDKGFALRYKQYSCVEYIKYDATKAIEFNIDVDIIIHGAGVASPELYVEKPVETMISNFNGVLNLLEYSRKFNVERILYVSSSEVYGKKEKIEEFEENVFGSVDINNIRSSYSEAKRASEVLCKAYASEYDVDVIIVRPGHIYGPTASIKDKRISSEFAYLAAQGKNLRMKSLGLQKRSYCYSLDCAKAILIALLNGKKGESYNIGHDEVTSIRQMAKILAVSGNVELEINEPTEIDLKQFNPMDNSTLNSEKIKAIGYDACFSVKEGLTHTVQVLKEVVDDF